MPRLARCALALATLAACGRAGEATTAAAPLPDAPPPPPDAPPPPPDAAPPDAAPPPPGRALTPGERAMVEPLFGAGVDYDKVRVIHDRFMPFQDRSTYMTPEGSIYAPGDLYLADFSAPGVSVWIKAVFVHEIAHVWQFQNGMDLMSRGVVEYAKQLGDYEKAYAYTLVPGRDLLDYGLEQQASILEDYWLATVHGRAPQRLENRVSGDERAGLYADVLAAFLKDPRYARGESAADVARRHGDIAAREPPGEAGCAESKAKHDARHLCGWRFDRVWR
jgi:hypothetical protein